MNMDTRHRRIENLIDHGPSLPLPDPAMIEADISLNPLTDEEKESFERRDAVQASQNDTPPTERTHYGLKPITQEQIDADKIDRLRKQIENSPTIEGSMNAAATLKQVEEKSTEHQEQRGLLVLPTQQEEVQPSTQRRPSRMRRITDQITNFFKKAA